MPRYERCLSCTSFSELNIESEPNDGSPQDPIASKEIDRTQSHQAHKDDDNYIRRQRIHKWAFGKDRSGRSAWIREHLPWKLYRPMFYPEGALYYCEGCNYERHFRNKSWYVKKFRHRRSSSRIRIASANPLLMRCFWADEAR